MSVRMSTAGKRLAALIAVVIAVLLPKHVECGFPDARCGHPGPFKLVCRGYEVEPLGVYVIELLARQDVGFAYISGEDCR